jgi:hypothetical protein
VELFRRHCTIAETSLNTRKHMYIRTNGGRCPFLVGRLCGVHQLRPYACRAYPMRAPESAAGDMKRFVRQKYPPLEDTCSLFRLADDDVLVGDMGLLTDQVIAYADRRTAAHISDIRDGTYRSESWVDSDGTGQTNIRVCCEMRVEGSDIFVDFGGSDPQARGGVNSSWATCQNAATTPILACLDPDIPHNQGCLKHITVTAPKGTITNVEWPGATADATIVPADKKIVHGMSDAILAPCAVTKDDSNAN